MSDTTLLILTPDTTSVVFDGAFTDVVLTEQTTVIGSSEVGPQGVPGPSGIYIGPTPPSNTTILWVDTS